ncbi:uncharacterized protein BO66DRAFT_33299 [Aspergillus aculeatinus CBS 121060]|uniref:Uncharacterized protein n=1 Tax=Aspergillus aculeatinus CBS 121060 TaxID=1448322 RepID=A0ACD1HEX1_9EURO|nr:hypothetical protein BO66DRAFT_33299 [Aspergillus aculeatinus CBS 121060]RAH72336.1 hypothetical protein BO66DRAFT_33299 [Aspergillus aculeatinus CBS 121060]
MGTVCGSTDSPGMATDPGFLTSWMDPPSPRQTLGGFLRSCDRQGKLDRASLLDGVGLGLLLLLICCRCWFIYWCNLGSMTPILHIDTKEKYLKISIASHLPAFPNRSPQNQLPSNVQFR